MDGFYNPSKHMRISLVMFLMIGSFVQVSRAITDSCPVSKETVEIVDNCPVTEEKWREAAAGKNCEAYASQCGEPERLVYHCVINAFINQTLEVCAYMRVIVLGFCTEYSFGGNLIQQNFRTNCSKFTQYPCPSSYPSTDAYKYPGCYEMTKKTAGPSTITTLSTVNATDMNNKKQANEGSSTGKVLTTVLVVVLLVLLIGFSVCIVRMIFLRKKRSFFRKKDCNTTYEHESWSLRAPESVDTETEKRNFAPSGQCIGNGLPNSAVPPQ